MNLPPPGPDEAPSLGTTPSTPDREPFTVRAARSVESASRLDALARRLQPVADALVGSPSRRDVLHGNWLGHAVHPLLTDFPLGMWASATLLDLIGGPDSRPAAAKLVGLGVLTAVPTAVTGLAEWAPIGTREKRVGLTHAGTNSVALTLYGASWMARRRSAHGMGVALAIAGGLAATVGGFFGGHLTEARKVSSRHPSFEDPGIPDHAE